MPYYPQPVTVKDAGTPVGTQPAINFIEGSNITLTITDDPGNNEVDVEIAASGGGTPAGSTTQVQYNDAGAFGASAAFTWDDSTKTMYLGSLADDVATIRTPNGDSGDVDAVGFEIRAGEGYDDGIGGNSNGGWLDFRGGAAVNGGDGGYVEFQGGMSPTGLGGSYTARGGEGDGGGGSVGLTGGYSNTGGGGPALLAGGGTDSGTPGDATVIAGSVDTSGNGGNVVVTATNGVGTNKNGGSITLTVGTATGSGAPGNLIVVNLPTSDPGISGALWIDGSNFLKVSP